MPHPSSLRLLHIGALSLLSTALWSLALTRPGGDAPIWQPRAMSPATERLRDGNTLEVFVRGAWQQLPMVPLADHLCRPRRGLFERYCGPPRPATQP